MKRALKTLCALALCAAGAGCAGWGADKPVPEPLITESPLPGMDANSQSSRYSSNPDESLRTFNMIPLDELMTSLVNQAFNGKVVEVKDFSDSLKAIKVSLEFSVPYRMELQKMDSILYGKVAEKYGIEVYPVMKDTTVWVLSVADPKKLNEYKTATKHSGGTSSSENSERHSLTLKNKDLRAVAECLSGKYALNFVIQADVDTKEGYDLEFSNIRDLGTTLEEMEGYGLSLKETMKNIEVIVIDGSGAKAAE